MHELEAFGLFGTFQRVHPAPEKKKKKTAYKETFWGKKMSAIPRNSMIQNHNSEPQIGSRCHGEEFNNHGGCSVKKRS